MRIISGSLKGRRLAPVEGFGTRPTSDRIREALFSILGQRVRGARVLDLFAGTGAFGIESLSRGAEKATLIDIFCDTIKKNLSICRLEKKACVLTHDLILGGIPKIIEKQKFDIVFMDPPYFKGFAGQILETDSFFKLLSKRTVILVEHPVKEKLEINHPGLDISRQKKYSKTLISFINKI